MNIFYVFFVRRNQNEKIWNFSGRLSQLENWIINSSSQLELCVELKQIGSETWFGDEGEQDVRLPVQDWKQKVRSRTEGQEVDHNEGAASSLQIQKGVDCAGDWPEWQWYKAHESILCWKFYCDFRIWHSRWSWGSFTSFINF